MSYDPNSTDSVLSKIITRLDNQDTVLAQILTEVRKTNGRVNKIETERAVEKGKMVVISAGISGFFGIASWFVTHFFYP